MNVLKKFCFILTFGISVLNADNQLLGNILAGTIGKVVENISSSSIVQESPDSEYKLVQSYVFSYISANKTNFAKENLANYWSLYNNNQNLNAITNEFEKKRLVESNFNELKNYLQSQNQHTPLDQQLSISIKDQHNGVSLGQYNFEEKYFPLIIGRDGFDISLFLNKLTYKIHFKNYRDIKVFIEPNQAEPIKVAYGNNSLYLRYTFQINKINQVLDSNSENAVDMTANLLKIEFINKQNDKVLGSLDKSQIDSSLAEVSSKNEFMYFNYFRSEYKNTQDSKTGGFQSGRSDLVYKLIAGISMDCVSRGALDVDINDIEKLVSNKILSASGTYKIKHNGKLEIYDPSLPTGSRIVNTSTRPLGGGITTICKIPINSSFKIVSLEKEDKWSYEKANENCMKKGGRLPYLYEVQNNREKILLEFKKQKQMARPIILKENFEYFLDKEVAFTGNSGVMGFINACLCVSEK